MINTDEDFVERCRAYELTEAEALRDAPLACYLYTCLHTGDGAPYPHPDTPYNKQLMGQSEAWTDVEFVRAAMERASPWLLMDEGAA